MFVANMAKHDSAEGSNQKPDCVRKKAKKDAGERVTRRKEILVENKRGSSGIKKKVVELDCRPDHASGNQTNQARSADRGCPRNVLLRSHRQIQLGHSRLNHDVAHCLSGVVLMR